VLEKLVLSGAECAKNRALKLAIRTKQSSYDVKKVPP